MRRGKQRRRPYRVAAAFDTETSNVQSRMGNTTAFFSLYQVGTLADGVALRDITAGNVRDSVHVDMYRHDSEAWAALLDIAEHAEGYVPVVAVHNLSFDIHAISANLSAWADVEGVDVLAKSAQQPITVTMKKGGEPYLVFWDTLSFSAKSLEVMGLECGYRKSVGDWDYSRIRTPETELTASEVRYAGNDIYALFAWLGYFFRRETLLSEDDIGRSLTTKTGVVRCKRRVLFEGLKGEGCNRTCGDLWRMGLSAEALRDDDYFYTTHAATRGGFTFASRTWAGKPFIADGAHKVFAYDATSQHPAHMVSHFVPYGFESAQASVLLDAFEIVTETTTEEVLRDFARPFPCGIIAAYDFTNLRIKAGTVFERDGIASLAYARLTHRRPETEEDWTMTQLDAMGYVDNAPDGCEHVFGKVFNAPYIRLYLTELECWVLSRIYEWDEVIPVAGYVTFKFRSPEDLSILSVYEFYRRKNELKRILALYKEGECFTWNIPEGVLPDYMAQALREGKAERDDLQAYYMQAKADLNSLYGIEITDEAKRDTVLTAEGIEYEGIYAAENLPKTPKAHYQYGQRIVGWSRVAQTLVIEGLGGACEAVINGDTDSVKVWATDAEIARGEEFLARYAAAVDRARALVTRRVNARYPDNVADLSGIGHYIKEAEFMRYYSAYNKAYMHDDYSITLAGVPSKSGGKLERGLTAYARDLERQGWTFERIAQTILGYNVTVSWDVTGLNGRNHPGWGERWQGNVTDWRGDAADVDEPEAIGLYPLSKTIGGYDNPENRINAGWAARWGVETHPRILTWNEGRAEVVDI